MFTFSAIVKTEEMDEGLVQDTSYCLVLAENTVNAMEQISEYFGENNILEVKLEILSDRPMVILSEPIHQEAVEYIKDTAIW